MTLYVYRCPRCHTTVRLVVAITPVPTHGDCGAMELVPDSGSAILPLEPPGPATLTSVGPLRVSTLKAAGILLPETQDALEWLYRHRARNGMAGAFLKVGGRRCIDLVAFARLMRERRA